MNIVSRFLTIKKLKSTSAAVFKNLKKGDVLEISIPIRDMTHGWNGSIYATTPVVKNMRTGETCSHHSLTEMTKYISCFEFEPVNEKEFLQELYNDLDTTPVENIKDLLIACSDARLKIKARLEALEGLDTD